MGIAAYNRGTSLVSRQIDEQLPDHNSDVVRSINKLPRGESRLWGKTYVRLMPHGKTWILMNKPEEGFASFGYEYPSLRVMFSHWNAHVVGYGRDKHSFFYVVETLEKTHGNSPPLEE